jgi:hypothetical protein
MTTPAGGSGTPGWRSRAFIQPLLLTVVGELASVVVVQLLMGPAGGAESSPVGNVPGIILGTLFLAVGLLMTGFVVGLTSRDRNLALGAVLAGAIVLTLPIALISPSSPSVVDRLTTIGGLIVLQLIPIGLGFGVGRLAKARAEKD